MLTTISDNDTVWYLRAIYKGVVGIYWTSRKHSPMYKGKRGMFLRKIIQNDVLKLRRKKIQTKLLVTRSSSRRCILLSLRLSR